MEALCGGLPFEPGLERLASSSSSSSFVGESVGAGVLTKHPPLEPGPEGNYHLTLKGNHHLTLKVDVTATATAAATASRFGGFKIHSRATQDRLKINASSF